MATLAKLTIDLAAKTGKLQTDLKRANKYTKSWADKSRVHAKTVTAALAGTATVAGVALVAAYRDAAEEADKLAKISDKIGIAPEKLTKLQHATSLFTSAGLGAMNEALTKASKRLGEFNASGGGAAAKWLEKLNLDTQELATLSPDQLFNKYAEAIRGLEGRGQQLAATSALMGDESRQLITLIDQMPSSLKAAGDEADALGLTMSRVDLAKIEAANDAVGNASKMFGAFGKQLAANVSPYVQAIAENFKQSAIEAGGFGQVATNVVDSVVSAVGFAADAVHGLSVVWGAIKAATGEYFNFVLSGLVKMDSGITAFLNKIPGVAATESAALQQLSADVATFSDSATASFKESLLAPMPSEKIKLWMEDVKTKADLVAAEMAANTIAGAKEGEEYDPEADPAVIAELARMEYLKALKETNTATEFESEELAYLNKQALLEQRFQSKLITEESRNKLLESLRLKHLSNVEKIEAKASKKEQKTDKDSANSRLGMASGFFSQMGALGGDFLKVSQALSTGQALIATFTGQAEALKLPFPANLAAAAKVGIAGFGFINSIKGAVSGGGSGGSSSPASIPSAAVQIPTTDNAASYVGSESESVATAKVIDITVNIEPDEKYSGAAVREMMERIGEEAGYNVSF